MKPEVVVQAWIEAFDRADVDELATLHAEDAVSHQVAESPIEGREAIRDMFSAGFATSEMICMPQN